MMLHDRFSSMAEVRLYSQQILEFSLSWLENISVKGKRIISLLFSN